jgi:hypothetical protein
MEQRSSGSNAAGSIAVVGGLLAVIGSFLTWANASAGRFAVSAKGIDGWEGKATIVGGIVLLVGGITAFTRGSSDPLKGLGLLGGSVVAGVGIYTAVTAKDRVIDGAASEIARRLGVTLEQARTAVSQAVDSGALKIALDTGLYIVIAGGLLGIVAGLLAMRSKPAAPAMPAAAGGTGLTGWAAPAAPATPSPTPTPGGENAPPAPPEPPPPDPGGGPAPT